MPSGKKKFTTKIKKADARVKKEIVTNNQSNETHNDGIK